MDYYILIIYDSSDSDRVNNHEVIKNYIFSACNMTYKLSFLYLGLKGLLRLMSQTILQICDLSDRV